MKDQEKVLAILEEITGEDFSNKLDEDIFADGIIDSMATVQLLLELGEQCDVEIPVSEFDRKEWSTPNKIAAKIASLR